MVHNWHLNSYKNNLKGILYLYVAKVKVQAVL